MARGEHRGLSEWVVTCFTINVIMGSGFLGVPRAVVDAGLLLSVGVLVAVTVLQWVAACLLTETCARVHALLAEKDALKWLTPSLVPLALTRSPDADAARAARTRAGGLVLGLPSSTSFELMMVCRLLLGRSAEAAIGIAVLLYQLGTLWSFCDVFAAAMTAEVPLPFLNHGESCDIYASRSLAHADCQSLYLGWLALFGVGMAALALMDLREQVAFQVAMTVARVLVIIVMVGSLLLAGSEADFGESERGAPPSPLPLSRPSGLATAVPVAVFCQLFHIGVPTLLQPLARKGNFGYVFAAALSVTLLLYTALGLSTASFFGQRTRPSCNINWRRHRSRPISLAVALFPAVDTFTVFPLNVLFLSNNVMSAVLGKRWYQEDVSRRARAASRVLCSLPPLLCAALFPSLSGAIAFTGLIGILLPFVITPLMHETALRHLQAHWDSAHVAEAEEESPFRTPFSSVARVRAFGAVGVALLVYTVVAQF